MSFIRKDVFTGSSVLISEIRGKRPLSILNTSYIETPVAKCPFCPGNEHMTPDECSDENWQTRFFPNKYPALETGQDAIPDNSGFYELLNGDGVHEIFVDTRSHRENLKDFSASHIEMLIRGLAERYVFYEKDKRIKYTQIFKNKGARAGASQSHSHWQIIAGGFVPHMQEALAARLSDYKLKTGKCLYCAVLENELNDGGRVIFENGCFAAFTPFASRFSFETWIVPKRHITALSGFNKEELGALANAVCEIIPRFERVNKNIDYNILFMDSPNTDKRELFHWHVQVFPKLGSLAGYEFSTGSYINHITPEKAAEILR